NSEDVTSLIRSPEVTSAASQVAVLPAVRRYLVQLQRVIAANRNMVCEGRDQGTVVFPDASCKFFLVPDPVERARRRQRELAARGGSTTCEEILEAQEARDRRDAARATGPMIPAADAVVLDSTHLSLDEVITRMEEEVRRRQR